jgi:uroporphyrinogen decarboxylase
VQALKARHPDIPVICFPRLAGAMLPRYAQEVGPDGISVDFTMPLSFARAQVAPHATLQGNLDPLLLAWDADAAIAQAGRILEGFKDRPFIFNLGHGMVPHTPPAHVHALSQFLKAYRYE